MVSMLVLETLALEFKNNTREHKDLQKKCYFNSI
jgi:hypothetical protein